MNRSIPAENLDPVFDDTEALTVMSALAPETGFLTR